MGHCHRDLGPALGQISSTGLGCGRVRLPALGKERVVPDSAECRLQPSSQGPTHHCFAALAQGSVLGLVQGCFPDSGHVDSISARPPSSALADCLLLLTPPQLLLPGSPLALVEHLCLPQPWCPPSWATRLPELSEGTLGPLPRSLSILPAPPHI